MKSQAYWQKRSEQVAARQFKAADDYSRELIREYDRAILTIQRDIEAFYQRFAANNEISLAEAQRLLTAGELKEFRMTLEEFTAKARNNADGRWTQELNNVYYRTRVSRFEALQVQIRQQAEMLAGSRQAGARELLGGIYTDTYHRTLFEIQRGTGIGVSFAQIDQKGLETVLGTEFAGSNWSKRIWGDRDKLVSELRTRLMQSFIRGDSVDRTVKSLVERMGVSRSNAVRLVQTESAFFTEQATMAGYKASGLVQEYEILATLDNRTSEICRQMDGKRFKVSEQEPGVNAPPFHAHCRTTTVPWFPDEIDPGERLARGADGQTYTVPGDMTYEQWKKQYVDSQPVPKRVILTSDKRFAEVLDKIPGASADYKQILADRFAAGSDEARRVFTDYVSGNIVNDVPVRGHYDPNNRAIKMSLSADSQNLRGPGTTYFHEHGHYVDNMAAIRMLGRRTYDGVSYVGVGAVRPGDFRKAILEDVQNYLKQYAKVHSITLTQAQVQVRARFSQEDSALYSAVSDIYGGATGNRLVGTYGHEPSYWRQKPSALEKEAFAHMFEASFDSTGLRLALIKEYLPTAYKVFKKILEVI